MKKNKMMRLASLLLVCVLLTTSVISGTFAKYTTSDTAEDSARVAHWGITFTNNEGNMFVANYESDTTGYTADTVIADADVVAPGTDSEDLTDLVVNGTPEVAVRVTYDATLTLENWNAASGEYCPIIFTVEGETYGIKAYIGDTVVNHECADVAALIKAVEEAIEACAKDYPANVAINNGTDAPTVAWSWPYSTSTANDKNDTDLGNADEKATISLTIDVLAEQID